MPVEYPVFLNHPQGKILEQRALLCSLWVVLWTLLTPDCLLLVCVKHTPCREKKNISSMNHSSNINAKIKFTVLPYQSKMFGLNVVCEIPLNSIKYTNPKHYTWELLKPSFLCRKFLYTYNTSWFPEARHHPGFHVSQRATGEVWPHSSRTSFSPQVPRLTSDPCSYVPAMREAVRSHGRGRWQQRLCL